VRHQVVGVIDLQRGRAVRGVGGQRDRYRPVVLTAPVAESTHAPPADGSDPLTLAKFYLDRGLGGLYVADLDALTGGPRQTAWLERLAELGAPLWIDAGFRGGPQETFAAWPWPERPRRQVHWILATEAIGIAPRLAADWLAAFSADRITISIDLVAGRLLLPAPAAESPAADSPSAESPSAESPCFPADSLPQAARGAGLPQGASAESGAAGAEPAELQAVVAAFYAVGVRSFLVLDLAAVGGGGGPDHLLLCQNLKQAFPDATWLSGGGIRDEADLATLCGTGVDLALVASALQNGAIFPLPGPGKD